MGEGKRTEEAGILNQELSQLEQSLSKNVNPDYQNRWEGWSPEFNYQKMSKLIDEITQGNIGEVNRQTNLGIQRGQSDLGERMASEGVASSSIAESGQQRIREGANRNRGTLLQQLYGQGLQGKLGAMSEANKYDVIGTQGAQGVDMQRFQDLLAKYGMRSGLKGQRVGNLQNMSDDTWLDDLMAVLNVGGNIGGAVAGAGGAGAGAAVAGGGAGAAVAASDIRLKENIVYKESINGIPVYEFNYIDNPIRFRGTIAQKIENIIPEAVISLSGIKHVDYSKLPFEMEVN